VKSSSCGLKIGPKNPDSPLQPQKFTVSHAGKQHAYHLANALLQLQKLEGFYTSSYVEAQWLQKIITKSGNQFFTRRFIEGLAAPYVHSHWAFEIKEMWMRRTQGKSLAVQNQVYQRDTDFDNMMARKIGKISSSHFWGFQGSCRATLAAAKSAGKKTICELATAHVVQARKILAEEAKLQPEWADSIDNLYFPPAYEKRLEEEPFVADWVVAASGFTQKTLIDSGVDAQKIKVLQLGFEANKIPFSVKHNDLKNRPLRLLFAGTITQRKGISYLLDAMDVLKEISVELHMVGGIQGSGKAFEKYKSKCHYYPPLSQYEMFSKYHEFDALVLPTVFEGFGLVIVEAMAAGLPVITTPHSMGPDVVTDGENGWIVPIRDSQSIAEKIVQLRTKTNEEYEQMRVKARAAALQFTWDKYRIALANLCGEI